MGEYTKALGGIIGAASAANAGELNARSLKLNAITNYQQTYADEEAQRREIRQFRGAGAAALAENGLSSDGSSAMMVDQSAANAELDALNTRYHGILRGLDLTQQSKDAKRKGYMLAGQQLLNSAGSMYGG